ncbi:DUF7878 domain-containing protein [Aeromicrobium sp. P5_D10]
MDMTYDRLNTDELRGPTQADYLIAFDADLRVVVGDETVYAEPGFPVVELARSLKSWLGNPVQGDFEFDSMSIEEVGSVAFRHTAAGWTFSSVFDPGASTPLADWAEVEQGCRRMVSRVEADLVALGLDPDEVLQW